MFLKTFPVGPFQCNCSIFADEKTGEAVVIDPGDEAQEILRLLQEQGFTVRYLLHTHAHLDHICATKEVYEKTNASICLHKADQFLYDNIEMQGRSLGLAHALSVAPVTKYLEHGDEISVSDLPIKVLHTPGHTPGSICFSLKDHNLLFAGDTLFYRSIGRTDLWGGDYDQIINSIKTKLLRLDPITTVIPGHGPKTTIGAEGQKNPFLS